MGPSDDYMDEMDRLSSEDAADRLRRELLVPPSPAVAERHLTAMRAAAIPHPETIGGTAMQLKTRKRLATLALAATLVLGAGIAAALTLPDTAAEQAQERTADLETPKGPGNQGGNGDIQSLTASEHGKAVSELAQDDSLQGCEHGRAVSDTASSKAENRQNEGDHPGPCGPGGSQGNGAAASAARGNNGNHGQSSNSGGQGTNAGGQGSNAGGQGSNAGGNGKSELPHGVETAPGRNSGGPADTGVAGDITTTPAP